MKEIIIKIRNLVYIMAVCFFLAVAMGAMDMGDSDFLIVIGLVELVVIIWLLILVNKKELN